MAERAIKQNESDTLEEGRSPMTGTTATAPSATAIEVIKRKAKRLSILSMMSTTAAGSGHPTSCLSAAAPRTPTRAMLQTRYILTSHFQMGMLKKTGLF